MDMDVVLALYVGFSFIIMTCWVLGEAFEGDLFLINRIRLFFYVLCLPATLFWVVIILGLIGLVTLMCWIAKKKCVQKLFTWLTKPL